MNAQTNAHEDANMNHEIHTLPTVDLTEEMTKISEKHNHNGLEMIREQYQLLADAPKPFLLELYCGVEYDDPAVAVFKWNTEMLSEGGLADTEILYHRALTYALLEQVITEEKAEPLPESAASFIRTDSLSSE